jgi:transposase
MPRARIAFESSTHTSWFERLLRELGHEVIVANSRRIPLISKSQKKCDSTDAEMLARLARTDPSLLAPIRHKSPEAQRDLAILNSRSSLVAARTQLINVVRSTVKMVGVRLPSFSADAFAKKVRDLIPVELRPALHPLLDVVGGLNERIWDFDRSIEEMCKDSYPETKLLRQISGVGPLTSLTFVLKLEDPSRFRNGRAVGSYIGLTPRRYESGNKDPELRITKAGDTTLRQLLVGAAHYILGPFGPETDLRNFGLRIAARGRKSAKKRAVVAVARKLSVLLHHLWRTGEVYEPLRNQNRGGSANPLAPPPDVSSRGIESMSDDKHVAEPVGMSIQ